MPFPLLSDHSIHSPNRSCVSPATPFTPTNHTPPPTANHKQTQQQVLQLLAENTHEIARAHFGAFYSSELGGIVTEPGFMVVGIDDHMLHKGDAVCESIVLAGGYLYKLEERLQRLAESAELAGIPLPCSEERLRRVLLDTAAASLKMNGELVGGWLGGRVGGGWAFFFGC